MPSGDEGVKSASEQVNNGLALFPERVTTLQDSLDRLIPGLTVLGLALLCMWLPEKEVSPIVTVPGLFVVDVVGHVIGLLQLIKI